MSHIAASDLVLYCLPMFHKKGAMLILAKHTYTALKFSSPFYHLVKCTVKPVVSGQSKIDKTKISMENGNLIKSIAECSPWSILHYF